MLLFLCTETTEFQPVRLETSCRHSDDSPPSVSVHCPFARSSSLEEAPVSNQQKLDRFTITKDALLHTNNLGCHSMVMPEITLTVGGSITVQLVSSFACLYSTASLFFIG